MKEEVELGRGVCVNLAMAKCKTKEKERFGFGLNLNPNARARFFLFFPTTFNYHFASHEENTLASYAPFLAE
jgi:hypothetical protein